MSCSISSYPFEMGPLTDPGAGLASRALLVVVLDEQALLVINSSLQPSTFLFGLVFISGLISVTFFSFTELRT